jgi:hypothetical protein
MFPPQPSDVAPQSEAVQVVGVQSVVVVVDVPSGQTAKQFSAPNALHAPPTPMLIHACPEGQAVSFAKQSDPALPTKHTGTDSQLVVWQPMPAVAQVPPQAPPHGSPHAMPPLAQVGAAVVVVVSVVVVTVSVVLVSVVVVVVVVSQTPWSQTSSLVHSETQALLTQARH